MPNLQREIESRVRAALRAWLGDRVEGIDPAVRPTADPRFGDFQANVALGLARELRRPPREVATEIVARLDVAGIASPPEIAGPGFINFRLLPGYLASQLEQLQADPRLGIARVARPQRVIVDFSSPNLAKEMHVGHLRSTLIGDAIARLLEFQGHEVLRLNHVGDWGTHFGMLIQYVLETQPDVLEHPERFRIDDLEAFYVAAKARFDSDPAFADAARRAVVALQSGEPTARRLWEVFCQESLRHAHEIYERLGVRLIDRGESFYNDLLPRVVQELLDRGIAVIDQGAVCVFLEGFVSREGTPLPVIIRKKDGGYNYETTDLAAIRYRIEVDRAERIIYVTDIRQRQHFEMVFAVARRAGWVPEGVSLEHVGFGMVLGPDRRPFRTREGGTVKLKELLDEAEARALQAMEGVEERRTDLTPEQRQRIARAVGIGAIKYFELSHNPASDYVFDWETMLSLEGNTAPYMLYAYARIQSIGRRAGIDLCALPPDLPILLEHESEIALARQILRLSEVIDLVSTELRPHHLTDYLFELSRAFSTFYDRQRGVRVIDAAPESVRLSRLRLCDLTARTLHLGLGLLGIEVVEQM